MLFFLFQMFLRNLNHRQYGLTYTIHLENTDQFSSKAHIANSDQDKIQIETHCPFKDSTYISIKSPFLLYIYLKYFWRISNYRQYRLFHVNLVNFGQSLLKSHIVWFMLNFTMFLANSDQEAIWTIWCDPYCPYKIFIKFRQKAHTIFYFKCI